MPTAIQPVAAPARTSAVPNRCRRARSTAASQRRSRGQPPAAPIDRASSAACAVQSVTRCRAGGQDLPRPAPAKSRSRRALTRLPLRVASLSCGGRRRPPPPDLHEGDRSAIWIAPMSRPAVRLVGEGAHEVLRAYAVAPRSESMKSRVACLRRRADRRPLTWRRSAARARCARRGRRRGCPRRRGRCPAGLVQQLDRGQRPPRRGRTRRRGPRRRSPERSRSSSSRLPASAARVISSRRGAQVGDGRHRRDRRCAAR